MASGSSSQHNFRKAVGALKDSTMVGMAKVNSEFKGLDIAILKATNHIEVLPKEKHVRKILDAVSASSPRADVDYCINALARRLSKTRTWAVAMKTLIIIHRALREVDQSFREELIGFGACRGHMLNMSHFKDDSSPSAWEYSIWIRIYGSYLEERLECFRILKYDFQRDHSKTKRLDTPELLEQLPVLQRLLFRLLACQPVGVARHNFLIQYALSIVAAESVRLYVAITDGVLNLIDKFFEMHHNDAVKVLEIYRKSGDQAERLSEFFEICRSLDFGRGQKYVKIEQPPPSFITAMEEYVMEAPQTLMPPWRTKDDDNRTSVEAIPVPQPDLQIDAEVSHSPVNSPESPKTNEVEAAATTIIPDLLSWDETSEPDDNNSLAISTVSTDELSNSDPTRELADWELALTTALDSNAAALAESKLEGGLDRLKLDSLYNAALVGPNPNGTYQMGMRSFNPFEDDSVSNPNHPQLTEMPHQEDAFIQYQHQESNYVQMNGMPQYQEAFIQQHSQQMTEMEGFTQQLDQQGSYAQQMVVVPYEEEAREHQQQQEQSMVFHDSPTPLENPFIEQDSKPCPTQGQLHALSLI